LPVQEIAMRIRAVVAVALVVLPAVAEAQRLRLPGRSRPTGPTALPPQAPVVAREQRFVRLPISMETYQIISYFDSPGLTAGAPFSTWTSMGLGQRFDYRVARHLSATLDVTQAMLGGPALTSTAELGMRLRRERTEHRFYPFLDLRYGYLFAMNSQARMMDFVPGSDAQTFGFAGGYNDGFGAIGGAGMEIALTNSFSITTIASAVRANMTAHDFQNSNPSAAEHFPMSAYRVAVGIRWNPVRYFGTPGDGRSLR
jgi:hypothetical protein